MLYPLKQTTVVVETLGILTTLQRVYKRKDNIENSKWNTQIFIKQLEEKNNAINSC